jgi:hypothetical protein
MTIALPHNEISPAWSSIQPGIAQCEPDLPKLQELADYLK